MAPAQIEIQSNSTYTKAELILLFGREKIEEAITKGWLTLTVYGENELILGADIRKWAGIADLATGAPVDQLSGS